MSRRKLIFFTTADPAQDPGAFFRVYHFANVAATAGLEAEVRLAGHAVSIANEDSLPIDEHGDDIRTKIKAAVDGPFLVSL